MGKICAESSSQGTPKSGIFDIRIHALFSVTIFWVEGGLCLSAGQHTGAWQHSDLSSLFVGVAKFAVHLDSTFSSRFVAARARDTCNGDQNKPHCLFSLALYSRQYRFRTFAKPAPSDLVFKMEHLTTFSRQLSFSITIVSTGQFEIGSHGTKLMVKSDAYGI